MSIVYQPFQIKVGCTLNIESQFKCLGSDLQFIWNSLTQHQMASFKRKKHLEDSEDEDLEALYFSDDSQTVERELEDELYDDDDAHEEQRLHEEERNDCRSATSEHEDEINDTEEPALANTRFNPFGTLEENQPGRMTDEEFKCQMKVQESEEDARLRKGMQIAHWAESLASILSGMVKSIFSLSDSAFFASESSCSFLQVRDVYGCICSETIPRELCSKYTMHNYVTTQGLRVLTDKATSKESDPFGDDVDFAKHPQCQVTLDRAILAAEGYSLFKPRGEQSGPLNADTQNPGSTIRVFEGNRQTQSGAKYDYAQMASSLMMYLNLVKKTGIVCFPYDSVCTNTQLVVNVGYTINLYKLANIYKSRAFAPEKIFNVRLRLPGREKCSLVVWGTGKCVCVGIVGKEKQIGVLRFFYPWIRRCLMMKRNTSDDTELSPDGTQVGKVDISKRRNRDNAGSHKRHRKMVKFRIKRKP